MSDRRRTNLSCDISSIAMPIAASRASCYRSSGATNSAVSRVASMSSALLGWALLGLSFARAGDSAAEHVDYLRDIAPIFARHCLSCHGEDRQQGGLRLDVRENLLRGGDSGEAALMPGDADGSALLTRVRSVDDTFWMPPEGQRLDPDEIARLDRWISSGANWPESIHGKSGPARIKELVVTDADRGHWAFRPLPALSPHAGTADQTIDKFIAIKLAEAGLSLNPSAASHTLVRRLFYDVIGLPPGPEEVAQFAVDDDPRAYEKLVDRLLAHPGYGERWARHWLDVARYADSDGYESDADRPGAYPFRDFVIRAFNDNMPYDQFVRWQLAGDEAAPGDQLALAALGFLAAGPVVESETKLEEERRRNRYDELDDMLGTIGSAFLGLTVGCARCHDHKYDPIPTRDYYSMQAALISTERRTAKFAGDQPILTIADRGPVPEECWLLERGDPMSRKEPVALGFLTVLTREAASFASPSQIRRATSKSSTGQRSALADWITNVERGAGALLARVFVNRVWQHHFGDGFVRTPNDFGVRGDAPTHPQLLDWLAARWIDNGWNVKALHREILLSAAYRQSSTHDASKATIDPENRWLGRRRIQRLEAESLRDAMLAVSGTLNPKMFGPGVKAPISAAAAASYNTRDPYPVDGIEDSESRRRSIYLFQKRSLRQPLLEAFDAADPSASCGRRVNTVIAPQSLALLNDGFVRRRALDFADRLLSEGNAIDQQCVDQAYRLALARPPEPEEALVASDFLTRRRLVRKAAEHDDSTAKRLALADMCQVLFALNEFMYID